MSIALLRPQVLIRLDKLQWSTVGRASIVHDAPSGMRMLRLDLSATAPTLYLSMQEVSDLLDIHFALPEDALDASVAGHA